MSLCESLHHPGLGGTKTKPFLVVVEFLSWWNALYYSKGNSYCKPVHIFVTHCSTGTPYFFLLAAVASISTLIAPAPVIITCKESRKRLLLSSGLRMKTEKIRQQQDILFAAFSPVQVRGWRHHHELPNQPKGGDHLFFSGKNFKQGMIWEKWILLSSSKNGS